MTPWEEHQLEKETDEVKYFRKLLKAGWEFNNGLWVCPDDAGLGEGKKLMFCLQDAVKIAFGEVIE